MNDLKEAILEAISEHYLEAARKGNPPPPAYYIRKCPPLCEDIIDILRALHVLEGKLSRNSGPEKHHNPTREF